MKLLLYFQLSLRTLSSQVGTFQTWIATERSIRENLSSGRVISSGVIHPCQPNISTHILYTDSSQDKIRFYQIRYLKWCHKIIWSLLLLFWSADIYATLKKTHVLRKVFENSIPNTNTPTSNSIWKQRKRRAALWNVHCQIPFSFYSFGYVYYKSLKIIRKHICRGFRTILWE